jgi:hypothetical protein
MWRNFTTCFIFFTFWCFSFFWFCCVLFLRLNMHVNNWILSLRVREIFQEMMMTESSLSKARIWKCLFSGLLLFYILLKYSVVLAIFRTYLLPHFLWLLVFLLALFFMRIYLFDVFRCILGGILIGTLIRARNWGWILICRWLFDSLDFLLLLAIFFRRDFLFGYLYLFEFLNLFLDFFGWLLQENKRNSKV